ncbi:MAG: hypothetical protein ACXV8J_03020, partial [Methylobacter sp.]
MKNKLELQNSLLFEAWVVDLFKTLNHAAIDGSINKKVLTYLSCISCVKLLCFSRRQPYWLQTGLITTKAVIKLIKQWEVT